MNSKSMAGWIGFAGILMVILGGLAFFEGLIAILLGQLLRPHGGRLPRRRCHRVGLDHAFLGYHLGVRRPWPPRWRRLGTVDSNRVRDRQHLRSARLPRQHQRHPVVADHADAEHHRPLRLDRPLERQRGGGKLEHHRGRQPPFLCEGGPAPKRRPRTGTELNPGPTGIDHSCPVRPRTAPAPRRGGCGHGPTWCREPLPHSRPPHRRAAPCLPPVTPLPVASRSVPRGWSCRQRTRPMQGFIRIGHFRENSESLAQSPLSAGAHEPFDSGSTHALSARKFPTTQPPPSCHVRHFSAHGPMGPSRRIAKVGRDPRLAGRPRSLRRSRRGAR